jgi:hypothetical protein
MLYRRVSPILAAGICAFVLQTSVSAQPTQVMRPNGFAISPPLSQVDDPGTDPGNHLRPVLPVPIKKVPHSSDSDPVVQTSPGSKGNAFGKHRFTGIGANGFAPSDVNIAVGPSNIVQTVNVRWAVFDKNGNTVAGPASLGSIWGALGGICTSNGGDPVVQYDRLADRWFLSQIGSSGSDFAECVAVSTTNNPAGSYYLWSFPYGTTLNDYPKWGVWPTATNSAYLSTVNLFQNAANFIGAQLCAYDRVAMLGGAPSPASLCQTLPSDGNILPVDLDGSTPPLDGTPGYFMTWESATTWRTYKLSPNFASNSFTFSQDSPDLTVASFNEACGGGTCIPQLSTTQQLDSLADRPMFRLAFRMFPGHESIVVNHSVTAGAGSGIRWYEFRMTPSSTSGVFSVFQQGTFAPADSVYRWMGSIAMDQAGDIGVGYSASGSGNYPAIRYTGRVPTDPAGSMETETSIIEGTGAQTGGLSRWGDYTAIHVDPSDDCTFWYTNQYLASTGSFNWTTHIGSFKFSGCGAPPTPDYTVSANPSSLNATQGGPAATSTISVTSTGGFSSQVNLTISGCPSGATCSVSPSQVTPPANGTATAGFSILAGSTAAATYQITVTGTDTSAGPHSTILTVTISAPAPDFGLTTSSPGITISRGQSGTLTLTATAIGGSSSVSLSASGNPNRSSVNFSPNPVTATGNSTMTISTNRRTPPGTYTVTITGKNSGKTHQTTVSLTIQ